MPSETSSSLRISELTSRWRPESHEPHRELGGVGGAWVVSGGYRSEEPPFAGWWEMIKALQLGCIPQRRDDLAHLTTKKQYVLVAFLAAMINYEKGFRVHRLRRSPL